MIELRLLGTIDLRSDDSKRLSRIVDQPKRLLLLAMLAFPQAGRPHTRDRIVGLLWPDFEPGRARAALRRALHFLRSHLGDGVLRGSGSEAIYLDSERVWCDGPTFSGWLAAGRTAEALELYRGPLLPGIVPPTAPAEQWLERQRGHLRRKAHEAATELAEEAERRSAPQLAARWYRRALDLVPTSEPTLRGLVANLARAGDRAGALAAYQGFVERLERQLEVTPAGPTVRLIETVRNGGRPPASTAGGPEAPTASRGRPEPRMARELVERADVLVERGRAEHAAAIELLRAAVELAPSLGEGWARLGVALAEGVQQYGRARQELVEGIDASRTAMALSPHLAASHYALGVNMETLGNLSAASRALTRAVRIQGDDVRARSRLGKVMSLAGDFTFGVTTASRLRDRRDVRDPDLSFQAGFGHYCLDMEDEGEEWYRLSLDLRPEFSWSEASWAFWHLTRGRFDEARRRVEGILRREPGNYMGNLMAGELALFEHEPVVARERFEYLHRLDPSSRHTGHLRSIRTYLAFLRHEAGDEAGAEELLAAAEAETRAALAAGADFGGLYIDMAAIHWIRGQRGPALAWIERSYDVGWRRYHFLRRDPLFAGLQNEDRFRSSLKVAQRDLTTQRGALG